MKIHVTLFLLAALAMQPYEANALFVMPDDPAVAVAVAAHVKAVAIQKQVSTAGQADWWWKVDGLKYAGLTPVQELIQRIYARDKDSIGCLIVIGIVGAIIVWGIWRICKKCLPPKPAPQPPSTNGTESVIGLASVTGPFLGPDGQPIVALQLADTDTGCWYVEDTTNAAPDGSLYQEIVAYAIESCTNLLEQCWTTEYTVTQWMSSTYILSARYRSDGTLARYVESPTAKGPQDLGTPAGLFDAREKCFRALSLVK